VTARTVVWLVAAAISATAPAAAQMTGAPAPGYRRESGTPASAIPAPLREIGFDQHIGQPLPLDATFRDERGLGVALGRYFGHRPVVLAFVYYSCPMLCTQVLSGLTTALNTLSLAAGRDFDVVVVSIDPRETPEMAADQKATFLARYRVEGSADGWHFLTGDQGSIDRLAHAAGFRFAWDDATQQFAHPAGVVVLTPDGRLARYLFGIEYGGRDLRFAIVEASNGRLGSIVDAVLLYCYHYDPMKGRYGLVIMRAVRVAGAATVLALGTFVFIMFRRENRRHVDGHSSLS
jgi:protein SCO1/2